jgi:hypothetical protein
MRHALIQVLGVPINIFVQALQYATVAERLYGHLLVCLMCWNLSVVSVLGFRYKCNNGFLIMAYLP